MNKIEIFLLCENCGGNLNGSMSKDNLGHDVCNISPCEECLGDRAKYWLDLKEKIK